MKVIVFEFNQESNSFCPVPSTMEDYLRCSVTEGAQMRRQVRGQALALNGMFEALEETGAKIIPGYAMRAPSGGVMEHSVLEHFLGKMRTYVTAHLPLDGALVSLHGASQSTREDDVCGVILSELRTLVGAETVIAASMDLHANVTEKMFHSANFLCGYGTYPHVDFYETGYRAARLAIRALQGEKDLHMARACVPLIAPASGYTTESGAVGEVVKEARKLVRDGVLEDCSIFQMQPWLDVKEGCGAVLTVCKDQSAAVTYATYLARRMFSIRDQMQPALCSIEEVIARAKKVDGDKPVLAVDFSDSVNAGAAGDNAAILEAVLAQKEPPRTAFVMIDREAVAAAFAAGVDAELDVMLGGTRDPARSRRIPVHARVCSLHDGNFRLEGPAMRGVTARTGRTAHLQVGNSSVIVCQALASTGDPQLFRHFGVELTLYQLVVVKACTSFRAAYTSIASEICLVDTHGAATAELESLPFRKLPRTLYPFDKSGNQAIVCISK